MTWIQKSDKFLPEISQEKLKQIYNKEKNAKAKLRVLAAIKRKEGNTLETIAYSLQKPKITIHDWLKRIDSEELIGRYDIKQNGNKSRLTPKQREELEKILDESPQNQNIPFTMWTTTLIQYIIYSRFNVLYNQSAIWKLTRRLHFSLKVPRPQNKKANKKLQEKFKAELKKKSNIRLNLDRRTLVLTKGSTT